MNMSYPRGVVTDRPVGLQDVMPTLLDAAGLPIPPSVTGRSVLPLMRGEDVAWRAALHGEHAGQYDPRRRQSLSGGRPHQVRVARPDRRRATVRPG